MLRFKLVETGKSYAKAEDYILTAENMISADVEKPSAQKTIREACDVTEVDFSSVYREAEISAAESLAVQNIPSYVDDEVYNRVMKWAADDPKRWDRIHRALLHIYTPRWEYIDDRDIIVAWAAAWLALTRARH